MPFKRFIDYFELCKSRSARDGSLYFFLIKSFACTREETEFVIRVQMVLSSIRSGLQSAPATAATTTGAAALMQSKSRDIYLIRKLLKMQESL